MAKFCRYCGQPVNEDAVFCEHCGKQLIAHSESQNEKQAAAKPARQTRKKAADAPAKQTKKKETAAPTKESKKKETAAPAKQVKKKKADAPAKQTKKKEPSTPARMTKKQTTGSSSAPKTRKLTASAVPGEIDCGEMVFDILESAPVKSVVTEQVGQVLSPIAGIFSGLGSFIGGIFSIFKRPSALIGTVLLAVLWYFLARMQDSGSDAIRALSFLTFAQGGFDDEIPAMVGGILGKGTVGAALISLLTGGFKNAFSGIGALFTGHGEKRGILSILFGLIAAIMIYTFFSGINPAPVTSIVGIAGAVLSLESLGGGSGRLYNLAQSLTSRVQNGVRTAARGRCDGLLTGLSLGFAFSAIIAFYV